MCEQELRPGAPQNAWIQSQTTCAVLVKDEDGKWQPKVVKQKIWVEGVCYELQEIYGMESGPAVPAGVSIGRRGTLDFKKLQYYHIIYVAA